MKNKMPKTKKEGILFGVIMCGLMVLFMGTINIYIHEGEITKDSTLLALKVFPLVFIIAMLVENILVGRVAKSLTAKFVSNTDNINAIILFNALFIVTGMSMIMTMVGGIMSGGIGIHLLSNFVSSWPRNFCMAMFIQLLIVGPTARSVIYNIHKIRKTGVLN